MLCFLSLFGCACATRLYSHTSIFPLCAKAGGRGRCIMPSRQNALKPDACGCSVVCYVTCSPGRCCGTPSSYATPRAAGGRPMLGSCAASARLWQTP